MHSDKMEDIEKAVKRATSWRCSVSTAPAGDTFTGPDRRYSMRSMFVPDPVIYYALVSPRTKRPTQLLQGAQPLLQGGPHLPRAP